MTWVPTPPEDLFKVEYLTNDGVTWAPCLFTNLRKGTVCRFYSCDGVPIHPLTHDLIEPGSRHIAGMCMADPIRNSADVLPLQGDRGHAVMLDLLPDKAMAN